MNKGMKFFECKHCGNIIAFAKSSGVPVMCCGEKMAEIIPGSVDAAQEKHVPTFKIEGKNVLVNVGSVHHPMTEEHLIEWVGLQTKQGNQRKVLKAGDEPVVCFSLCPHDEVVSVLAYCNLHGLWEMKA